MIVTLTAHPALDLTVQLAAPLVPGGVQSAVSSRSDAAGKGVNVARVVLAARVPVLAVLPLSPDDPYADALAATGLRTSTVPVRGSARTNITVADPGGTTTKLNLPGAGLDAEAIDLLVDRTVAAATGAAWLVLAGSLPPGAPDDLYARVAAEAKAAHPGLRVAVDTSGAALRATVAGARVDLVKPNDDELSDLTGIALQDADDAQIVAATSWLVPSRSATALVTLGARGALLVDADGAWRAHAPRIAARSTVGAGDSSLAGYLLAQTAGAGAAECLRAAVRYGAAAAALPGTQPPTPADLPHDVVDVRPVPAP